MKSHNKFKPTKCLTATIISFGFLISHSSTTYAANTTPLTISLLSDTNVCAGYNSSCIEGGFLAEPSSATNNNPARLFFQVQNQSGNPVQVWNGTGTITFTNRYAPAPYHLVKYECDLCTQSTGSGFHTMWVQPVNGNNWKKGTYSIQIEITVGNKIGSAISQITIQ